jgi:hypothetical protein
MSDRAYSGASPMGTTPFETTPMLADGAHCSAGCKQPPITSGNVRIPVIVISQSADRRNRSRLLVFQDAP